MTQRNILHCALVSATAIAFLAAGPAFAQDTSTNIEEPREETNWFSPNFQLHRKSGFSYTRHLKVAEKPFIFRIQGPVLRKQEALGLTFKIRF